MEAVTESIDRQFPKEKGFIPKIMLGAVPFFIIIVLFAMFFYRSLEREIYMERTVYLKEISAQIVSTTDTVASAQWDMATIFANQLQNMDPADESELSMIIADTRKAFAQPDLTLLVFDKQGNYYDERGNRVRWQGSDAVIDSDAPERQVEITTLPTTTSTTDEMVFVQKMSRPVSLGGDDLCLTHVAVVRNMAVFNETFQVPSFQGKGENYIVSSVGTRVYRGQIPSEVIGDVFNVLKPLERFSFHYGGSFTDLQEAVEEGTSCSLEFTGPGGELYFVTSYPMTTSGWSLLSIVPSDVVSARMQSFLRKTLFGIGAIALIVVGAVSTAVFLILRDRSNRRTNLALQEAARTAQEASRAKTVFLSHMSHDIRTPINGIMGMTDIATRNMGDPARLSDCLEKITAASRHLLSLVNDVLDMSRIESGKVQLEEKPFYIDALLDGCYSVIAGQAIKKKLDLCKDFTGITQPCLLGDELHLRQIIINILGNAVKFTPEGGRVEFLAKDEPSDNGWVFLSILVADNGIGMSEEFQQKIFDPFSQAEDGGRSRYQGTGLGMSIVKQLVDLMGGEILLHSAPGEGSTFTVRLRLAVGSVPERGEHHACTEVELAGFRVLLVEDNSLNLEIATYILEECGVKVTTAENGREAVDTFMNTAPGSFDVILMDVMMPVMDGLEATRAIRAGNHADAAKIPIIAMTANAYAEDRRAALEAGMNLYLAKPLEREELIRTLYELRMVKK